MCDPADLDRVYAEWQEAEKRALQWINYRKQCEQLPDTPSGRERERYLRQQASFSPAYFSGSEKYLRHRATHTSRNVLQVMGSLGLMMHYLRYKKETSRSDGL